MQNFWLIKENAERQFFFQMKGHLYNQGQLSLQKKSEYGMRRFTNQNEVF